MGDLLFAFNEWIRSTWMTDAALAISDWPLSLWIVTHFWAIPTFQVIHILSIAGAFGAILMIHLRLVGSAGTTLSIAQTSARYIPWVWTGFVLLILSGFMMIVGEPVRELINPIFWIKMGLVIFAILVSLWFHGATMKRLASNGGIVTGGTKAASVFVIVLWCVIMLCGRWIAYAPV